jgi:hypothetical protein
MVADVAVATALVVTGKVAEIEPAGTVTLAGTTADGLLSESVTTAPPMGAVPLRVTVAVDVSPPITLAGLSVTEDATVTGALIASAAVCVTPA